MPSAQPAALLELTSRIGVALLQVQQTEKILDVFLKHVLPALDPDALITQNEARRGQTLGQLLGELRKKLDVDPTFDELLKSFLKDRNDFAHDLFRVPHFNLGDDGVRVGLEFVTSFTRRAVHIRNVLMGFNRMLAGLGTFTGEITPNLSDEQMNELIALMSLKISKKT